MQPTNLFSGIPSNLPRELLDTLWQAGGLRVERIVSPCGHATPPGQWYDQDGDEWILVLTGSAGLRIDGRDDEVILRPGDSLLLPAHQRHRVDWTDTEHTTIWLAVHHRPTCS